MPTRKTGISGTTIHDCAQNRGLTRPVAVHLSIDAPARCRGVGQSLRYNSAFAIKPKEHSTMEAERINAIGNKIADLAARGAELRRYL